MKYYCFKRYSIEVNKKARLAPLTLQAACPYQPIFGTDSMTLSHFDEHLNRPLESFVKIPNELLQELIAYLVELSSRGEIRITGNGKYSVYDVIARSTNKKNPRDLWKDLLLKYPNLSEKATGENLGKSSGYLETPVADLAATIEIIWLLPGEFPDKFRGICAKLIGTTAQQQDKDSSNVSQDLMSAVGDLIKINKQVVANYQKLEAQYGEISQMAGDYLLLRKASDKNYPGLVEIIDTIIEQKALTPVLVEFTSSQWLDKHAPLLSQRQRICFYKALAAGHRLLVAQEPKKVNCRFIYNNRHEVLLQRSLMIAETMFPAESLVQPAARFTYQELNSLSPEEQSLVNSKIKLSVLSNFLGFPISMYDTVISSGLGIYIKGLIKNKELITPKPTLGTYLVTPALILAVKEFHNNRGGK